MWETQGLLDLPRRVLISGYLVLSVDFRIRSIG